MWEWVTNLFQDLTWKDALVGAGLFIVMFALSLAEVVFILVKLPPHYFTRDYRLLRRDHRLSPRRVLFAIGKNLLGLVHIVVGIALSLPGVPGQGVLTILIGVMLMDLPGVRWLERKLVNRPKVAASINRIRARFGKPPLVLDA